MDEGADADGVAVAGDGAVVCVCSGSEVGTAWLHADKYHWRFCQKEIAPLTHFSKPPRFASREAAAGVEEVNKSVV